MTCDSRHLDGAYVLGALAPAERQLFERHLADCADCARRVRELAGLPGLLGRLDADAVAGGHDEPPPRTLLPQVLQEARRLERRRRLVTAGLAAAAAVRVGVTGTVAAYGLVDGDGGQAASQGAGAQTVPGLEMTPVSGAPVSGRLGMESVAWGTRLDLTCTYAAAGDRTAVTYLLVVTTTDGRSQQVGTWRALPARRMQLVAATAAHRDDIEVVEVRLASGPRVLELRL